MATAPARGGFLTVSELNRQVKAALEGEFPAVWVKGELTGFKVAPSGHRYFSLKDERSVLDCALYQADAAKLKFAPKDGMAVEAYGRVSVFEPRGRYQLIVEGMRPAGLGERLLAYEELKRRLQAEGLFDLARKRALPRFPQRVGLVTSARGAAVRDLITVLQRRWPSIGIVLAPVRVQGEGAAAEIAAAIRRFDRWGQADLLIVGRGGGSLEDLWAFNEEVVVRAIAGSRVPIVSAVGHEGDVTLADQVADVRAATPSNAAELAVRDRREIAHRVDVLSSRLHRAMRHELELRRQRLDHVFEKHAFRNPIEVFAGWRRRLDDWSGRMSAQVRRSLQALRRRLDAARQAYGLREFPRELHRRGDEVAERRERLESALAGRLEAVAARIAAYDDRLRALSPRQVMERGYCLVRGADGRLLRVAAGLAPGDSIRVEFARGEADARVETVRTGEEHGE